MVFLGHEYQIAGSVPVICWGGLGIIWGASWKRPGGFFINTVSGLWEKIASMMFPSRLGCVHGRLGLGVVLPHLIEIPIQGIEELEDCSF